MLFINFASFHLKLFTNGQPFSANQCFPGLLIPLSQQQDFHPTTAWEFSSKQTCWDNPGLIRYQDITSGKEITDIFEDCMLNFPGISVQD
jgi:hypothetical protein